MRTLKQVADLVADTLMPDAPDLVRNTAEAVARAILDEHVVVKLPPPNVQDDEGVSWRSEVDGYMIATVSGGNVWAGDDLLRPDEVGETAAGLLAAQRMAEATFR